LIEKGGPYDTRLCFSSDVEFIARAATFGAVACLPEALYVFRISPTGISSGGSYIQREILNLIRALGKRHAEGKHRDFTAAEIERLNRLKKERVELPTQPQASTYAFYEARVATILRVNGRFHEAMKHVWKALTYSPTRLITDKKLMSTAIKSGFGFRPDRKSA
jgi:hypothetical protein